MLPLVLFYGFLICKLIFFLQRFIFLSMLTPELPTPCKGPFIKHPSNYPSSVCHLFAAGPLTAKVYHESNEYQRLSVLWNSGGREGSYPCGWDRKC